MKSLIVVHSWHHNSTAKVAEAMASVLRAEIKTPLTANVSEFADAGLLGFGAGPAYWIWMAHVGVYARSSVLGSGAALW